MSPFNKGKLRSEKKKEKEKTVISFSCLDPDKFEDLIWGNLGMYGVLGLRLKSTHKVPG